MPSTLHEILIELFRTNAQLASDLLCEMFGVVLPKFASIHVEDAQLNEIVPTEYCADLALLFVEEEPIYGAVIEVQLHRDEDKRYSWPVYATAFRSKYRCPVDVLVVTPSGAVAEWAGRPIELSKYGNRNRFEVLVLGPDAIPWVGRGEDSASPELAVLSALAHGNDPGGLEVVLTALAATSELDSSHSRLYYDQIVASLNDAVYTELQTMLEQGEYQWQSKLVKQWVREGLEQGREQGLEQGREQGLEQGREQGLEQGREQGRIGEARRAILTALEVRKLAISAQVRQRIEACADIEKLERWHRKAIVVSSAAEIFA